MIFETFEKCKFLWKSLKHLRRDHMRNWSDTFVGILIPKNRNIGDVLGKSSKGFQQNCCAQEKFPEMYESLRHFRTFWKHFKTVFEEFIRFLKIFGKSSDHDWFKIVLKVLRNLQKSSLENLQKCSEIFGKLRQCWEDV